jgi:hypothetical protein
MPDRRTVTGCWPPAAGCIFVFCLLALPPLKRRLSIIILTLFTTAHLLDTKFFVAIHTIIFTNTHTHHFSYVFNTLVKVAAAASETLCRLHNSSSNYISTKESVATKAAAAASE